MITLSRGEAQQALACIKDSDGYKTGNPAYEQASAALAAALAQPAGYTDADCLASEAKWEKVISHAPVYVRRDQLQKAQQSPFLCELSMEPRQDRVPLYTTPQAPARELTNKEIGRLWHHYVPDDLSGDPAKDAVALLISAIKFARAVLAAREEQIISPVTPPVG